MMSVRQRLSVWLCGSCLMLTIPTSMATAVTLQTLVQQMHDSPATTATLYDEEQKSAELTQRLEATNWSLFGGADSGRYRDLEKGGLQKYTGYGAQLGLRYPLLGTLQKRHAEVVDAQIAKGQASHSVALTRAEQQQQLRQTYIDWWQQEAIAQWCSRYQALAATEQALVAQRAEQQQLRLSEKLWVEQRWQRFTPLCSSVDSQQARLRKKLVYLYGNPLAHSARPVAESLPVQLSAVEQWLPIIEQHPALQMQRTAEHELQAVASSRWSERVDANFTISQRYDNHSEISGSGGGTMAAINFEIPLDSLTRATRANPAAARYVAAQYRAADTKQALLQTLERTLLTYQQRLDRLLERRQGAQQMQQLLQEQLARQSIDAEGGFMNVRQAQLELAEVDLELINDWQAAWSVFAQLQVLTDNAPPLRSTEQLHWSSVHLSASQPSNGQRHLVRPSKHSWSTAAYVWDSAALLAPQQREQQIELLVRAGFNRVYLGFNAAQVGQLERLTPQIRELIAQLKQRGFVVDLLLGDPNWLRPEQRHSMLQLIDRFASLPFDHLHLDLEVEQLGWPVPESRLKDWLDTLAAAAQRSAWPVNIVSHHRWFAPEQQSGKTCIPCALPTLNISSVTLMLYSTVQQSVSTRIAAILPAWPKLQFQLAQSVEAQLPVKNSWRGSSGADLQALNTYFYDQLHPQGLKGIAWQDWAHYPHPVTEKQQP